jgi:hypothetical protein
MRTHHRHGPVPPVPMHDWRQQPPILSPPSFHQRAATFAPSDHIWVAVGRKVG